MNYVVQAFGLLILIAGVIIVLNPAIILARVKKYSETLGFQITVVVLRLIIGSALIMAAEASKFPNVIEFLGILTLAGAVIAAVIGRNNFKELVAALLKMPAALARVSGAVSALIGGLLIYALM